MGPLGTQFVDPAGWWYAPVDPIEFDSQLGTNWWPIYFNDSTRLSGLRKPSFNWSGWFRSKAWTQSLVSRLIPQPLAWWDEWTLQNYDESDDQLSLRSWYASDAYNNQLAPDGTPWFGAAGPAHDMVWTHVLPTEYYWLESFQIRIAP